MHYVDTDTETLVWPHTSVTGHSGRDLLDTGWDLHWPGPGRVYLDDRDIVDIIVPALGRDPVVEALVSNGWTAPGETAERVELLEQLLDQTSVERDAALAEADGLLAALRRSESAEIAEPEFGSEDLAPADDGITDDAATISSLTLAAAAETDD